MGHLNSDEYAYFLGVFFARSVLLGVIRLHFLDDEEDLDLDEIVKVLSDYADDVLDEYLNIVPIAFDLYRNSNPAILRNAFKICLNSYLESIINPDDPVLDEDIARFLRSLPL